MKPPVHGGRLREMAQRTGIPASEWLDLSTGINPNPWPVPPIPEALWHRLPEDDDELPDIARRWAGAPSVAGCVPVAGSQAAIQALPYLRGRSRVGVPMPGYREHAYRWHLAGHDVVPLAANDIDEALSTLDVLVVIQPNNPTGMVWPVATLLRWHQVLAARGGWLVVDEAFIDPLDSAVSMAPFTGCEGLVVLRSLGKFFGLAGVRAGLLYGSRALCMKFSEWQGPWAVSGAGQAIMKAALSDTPWQNAMRDRLREQVARLRAGLNERGLSVQGETLLSCYCPHVDAREIADQLVRQSVLVRFLEDDGITSLRFGLPAEHQWQRLFPALEMIDL